MIHPAKFRAVLHPCRPAVIALIGVLGLCLAWPSIAGPAPEPEPFRRFAPVFDRSGLSLETDGAASDGLGTALEVSGDWMVTGAPSDDVAGDADRGSAYVWQRSAGVWLVQQKLIADDGGALDRFGAAVAIDGDTVVVGAPGNDFGQDSGAAYVFERIGGSWQRVATLVGDDPTADRFGSAVAIDGGVLAIGAPGDSVGSGFGAAQIHRRAANGTWVRESRVAITGAGHFGATLDLDGDVLLVGAPLTNVDAQTGQGTAYVFEYGNGQWTLRSNLIGSLDVAWDAFGTALALDGDRALVSAIPSNSSLNWPSRTAYVFTRNATGWHETAQLFVDKLVFDSRFGSSLDLEGDLAVVGDASLGNVYLFQSTPTGWSPAERIAGSAVGGGLQGPVRIDGARLLAGSPGATVGEVVRQGAVVSLSRTADGWTANPRIALGSANPTELGKAYSISVDGNWMAVGVPTRDAALLYRFDGSQWHLSNRFTGALVGASQVGFGVSVALSGQDLIVGASLANTATTTRAGRLFRFRFDGSTWVAAGELLPTGTVVPGYLGYSMAVDGDTLLAGAPTSRVGDFDHAGAGFVFVRQGDGWVHTATLVSDEPNRGGHVAVKVALDGNWALLGSPFWDRLGGLLNLPGPGRADLFERSGPNWTLIHTWTGPEDTNVAEALGTSLGVDATRGLVAIGAPERHVTAAGGDLYGGIDVVRLDNSNWLREQIPGLRRPSDSGGDSAGALGYILVLRDGVLAAALPRTDTTGTATDQWPSTRVYRVDAAPSVVSQTVIAVGATSIFDFGRGMHLGPDGQWMIPRADVDGPAPYGGANVGAIEVYDRNRLFSADFE